MDAGLDFAGTTVRPGVIKPQIAVVYAPKFFGAPVPSEEEKAELVKASHETIEKIDTWLTGKDWIGGDAFSLADLQVFNELTNY